MKQLGVEKVKLYKNLQRVLKLKYQKGEKEERTLISRENFPKIFFFLNLCLNRQGNKFILNKVFDVTLTHFPTFPVSFPQKLGKTIYSVLNLAYYCSFKNLVFFFLKSAFYLKSFVVGSASDNLFVDLFYFLKDEYKKYIYIIKKKL